MSGFGRPVAVGEAVSNSSAGRRRDGAHPPPARVLVALRAGHEVVDRAARGEVVVDHGGRVGRRPPPALQLAWVGPDLPHALHGGAELGGDGHPAVLGVLDDIGDGHGEAPSSRILSMRSIRAPPERLELVEQAVHLAKDTGHPPDPLLATVPALDDEPRPLEHRHVLLHRREAHRVAAGQLGDRLLLRQHDRDDVATGGVGERVEHVVGATYNHMVVR
jgi:hypothetical protein